jgi:polyhydroxybutyrate depolymerase
MLFIYLLMLVLAPWAWASSIYIPAPGRPAATVFAPDSYSAIRTYPVVVLLHGYSSNSALIDTYFGFSAQIPNRDFILVVPNGKIDSNGLQFWNATEGCCDFDHSNSDDVGYVKELVAQVEALYSIDKARVYAAGHSNGGFMSYRLACEPDSPFTRIASFAGETFLDPSECKATHPVSVLQIHALDDDTIYYNGDAQGYSGLKGYPGTQATVAQWLTINGCKTNSVIDLGTAVLSADNTAQLHEWNACAGKSKVQLATIQPETGTPKTPHTPVLTDEFTRRVLDFLLN